MELKSSLRSVVFSLALLTAATPAWCGKDTQAAPVKAVNINTADAQALAGALKGVGKAKAEAIIAYRKEHGPFKSPEQLSEVKGIGEKLFERNREVITVK